MRTIVTALLFLLAGIGIFLCIRNQHAFAALPHPLLGTAPTSSLTATAVTGLPPFWGAGVVIFDRNDYPYVLYRTPSGTVGMKRLVFPYEPGCQANALPCATPLPPAPVYTGERITVTGSVNDERLLVEGIEETTVLPEGMEYHTVSMNETITAYGVSIKPVLIADNGGCTLGVGCFSAGTERVVADVTYANKKKQVTESQSFVEGVVVRIDGVRATLVETGDTSFTFLVAQDVLK